MLGIGDFARYAGVSVRMLRHYDQLGLLVPSSVDPVSGYRHYDEALLERAHTLVALKELGFSLEEVGRLLDGTSPDERRALLVERRADLRRRIEDDGVRLVEVERRLRLLEGEKAVEFEEKALPPLELVQLGVRVDDYEEVGRHVGRLFNQLADRMVAAGRPPSGPAHAVYHEDGDGIRVGVGWETEPVEGAEQVHVPGAARALVATYAGPMRGISEAWQELGAHAAREGLTLSGPSRELYLRTDGPEDTWVTELQQPVS